MNWSETHSAIAIGVLIFTAIILPAALWWLSKRFATRAAMQSMTSVFRQYCDKHDQEHAELEEQLKHGDVRFMRLETQLAHLPNREDIAKLREHMSRLEAQLEARQESEKALTSQVNKLIDRAMEGNDK